MIKEVESKRIGAPVDDDAPAPVVHKSNALWGLSSKDSPLKPDEFIKQACTGRVADPECSFNSWGPEARSKFLDHLFVRDEGAIPKNRKFSSPLSRSEMHPGVCRTDDTQRDLFVKVGLVLRHYLTANEMEGKWVRVAVATREAQEEVLNDWEVVFLLQPSARCGSESCIVLAGIVGSPNI